MPSVTHFTAKWPQKMPFLQYHIKISRSDYWIHTRLYAVFMHSRYWTC